MKSAPTAQRKPTRWTLTEAPVAPPSPRIRQGLAARVIYFPQGWLDRIESRGPGALNELISLALDAYTKGAK